VQGPVAYGACLNRQIASLQRSPDIPSLSGYDSETRRTIELACVSEKVQGPVAYRACLNRQIASLQKNEQDAVRPKFRGKADMICVPTVPIYDYSPIS
jgi:hypothetical protein